MKHRIRRTLTRLNYRLSYSIHQRRIKWRLIIIAIIILLLIFYIFSFVEKRLVPIATSLAQSKAQYIVTMIINETINEHLANGDLDYDNFYNVVSTERNTVAGVTANVVKINRVKSYLTQEIQTKMNEIDAGEIFIPIGSLFEVELFANRGIKLPIKLLTAGFIEMNFTDNFTDAGINQTKHEIDLNITGNVTVFLPTGNTVANVATSLPIAQTIIVGQVPSTYTNVNLNGTDPLKIIDVQEQLEEE